MNPTAEPLEIVHLKDGEKEIAYSRLNGLFAALPSRKSLKKAIKAKRLKRLNDDVVIEELTWLYPGDRIALLPAYSSLKKWDEKITVVYEDDHLAVVVKVAGMVISGNQHRTLVNALPSNLTSTSGLDAMPTPQPVHRLDKATKGLVICAKTYSVARSLSKDFATGKIQKVYRAHVIGKIERELYIDAPIESKAAETRVVPVQVYSDRRGGIRTEVLLYPLQGRTHQLRKHLSWVNHPIVGDNLYGTVKHPRGSALMLTAEAVNFRHPKNDHLITVHY